VPATQHDPLETSSETPVAKPKTPTKKSAKKATAKRGTMNAGDVTKIVNFLREQSKNRPSRRTTLEHHVVHILGNEVNEKAARALVDRLVQDKQIVVTTNKVEYRLSNK
jgi:hypothetical protein